MGLYLDVIDYVEPAMLIVGSRGLGNLKGYVPNLRSCWHSSDSPHLQYLARLNISLFDSGEVVVS